MISRSVVYVAVFCFVCSAAGGWFQWGGDGGDCEWGTGSGNFEVRFSGNNGETWGGWTFATSYSVGSGSWGRSYNFADGGGVPNLIQCRANGGPLDGWVGAPVPRDGATTLYRWDGCEVPPGEEPPLTNWWNNGCWTNPGVLGKDVFVGTTGTGPDGTGHNSLDYSGFIPPGGSICWNLTNPWPFEVEVYTIDPMSDAGEILYSDSANPLAGDPVTNSITSTGVGNIFGGAGGGQDVTGGGGGSTPNVSAPESQPRTNVTDQATADANAEARHAELLSLLLSSQQANQTNANIMLSVAVQGAQLNNEGFLLLHQDLVGIGGTLDGISNVVWGLGEGTGITNAVGTNIFARSDQGTSVSNSVSALVPSWSIPSGSAPSITLPFSSLGFTAQGLTDQTWAFDDESELDTLIGTVRAIFLLVVTWAVFVHSWRTLGQIGGLT